MTVEFQALFGAVIILFLLIMFQVLLLGPNQGLAWGLSARDEPKPLSKLQGRVVRATANHVEALMMFAPLVLMASAMNVSTGLTVLGATLFVIARALYVAAYLIAIPPLRTIIFIVGLIGTILIGFEVGRALF